MQPPKITAKSTRYKIVEAVIFEDSVSGVIPVAVDKINKMAESGSPRSVVNEVGFCWMPTTHIAL